MPAGRPPFGGSALAMLEQHRVASLPMEHLPPLPDTIVNPIRRSMEKDPVDRYSSASEFAGARGLRPQRGTLAASTRPTPFSDKGSSTLLLKPSTPPQLEAGYADARPAEPEPAETTLLTPAGTTPSAA